MIPTFIGVAQILIGALLLFGSVPAMLAFVMLSGLMGGSAALQLPALGGSSIPPIDVALGFLVLRLLREAGQQGALFRRAAVDLAPLIVFVLYGLLMAYIGPRLFAHGLEVTPLRPNFGHFTNQMAFIYATAPLRPSPQNVTTSVYLIGTLLLAFASHVALGMPRGRDTLVRTAALIGLTHSFLGVFGLLAAGTPAAVVLDVFRNGSYAQLTHEFQGFSRISGILPEASSYGIYGFVWLVFLAECALRGVRPRLTGAAALVLVAVLAASTSSTAYFGLGLYGAMLVLRVMLIPRGFGVTAVIALACVLLGGAIIVLGVCAAEPKLASSLGEVLTHFTVDKGDSLSGLQRAFWARQGWHAFLASHGLGIGPGSYRSSSIATSILGSVGVIGAVAFLWLLLSVWKPWGRSTWTGRAPDPAATGAAAGWACLMLFCVQSIALPSPDPGPEFALLAGAALSLRRLRLLAPARLSAARFSMEPRLLQPLLAPGAAMRGKRQRA
ncbi:hypothetical protein [Sphingomonas aracearum]|uniref:O-antigen ligase like membrane protein n=1 Tax=Sphingomonas aracearum TaxID=2283317 RepID=A0A369VUS2_9SPHN|nr:hypothetical protein [Sphingomonas aracearum]RDE05307.1 hypothetical protein DVW87_08550 [Sphingomonas aracearum]